MNEEPIPTFEFAIQTKHGARSKYVETVPVVETFRGKTVWEGDVLVFELLDHPTAPRCYAWSVDGRITAVLHEPPVDNPSAAVRAAIAAQHRRE